jgi:hypothetical protein
VSSEIASRYAALQGNGLPTFSEARLAARRERNAVSQPRAERASCPGIWLAPGGADSESGHADDSETADDDDVGAARRHSGLRLPPMALAATRPPVVLKRASAATLTVTTAPADERPHVNSAPPTGRSQPSDLQLPAVLGARSRSSAPVETVSSADPLRCQPSPQTVRAPLALSTAAFSLSEGLSMRRRDPPPLIDGPAMRTWRLGDAASAGAVPNSNDTCRCGKASNELFVRQVVDPRVGLVHLCALCGLPKKRIVRPPVRGRPG